MNVPRLFNLFWLNRGQIGQLNKRGMHHGPLDNPKTTNTRINIFQQADNIAHNLLRLDDDFAFGRNLDRGNGPKGILVDIYHNGRAQFTLSDEFLAIIRDLNINIPFADIEQSTNEDSVIRILESHDISLEMTHKRSAET